MNKTLLSFLPILLELKSLMMPGPQSGSNFAADSMMMIETIKKELQSLLVKLASTLVVAGLVIFACIRLLERAEAAIRTLENGEAYLLIGYVLIVLLGANFFVLLYRSKPETKPEMPKEASTSTAPAVNIESIVASLITGFYEGMEKQKALHRHEDLTTPIENKKGQIVYGNDTIV